MVNEEEKKKVLATVKSLRDEIDSCIEILFDARIMHDDTSEKMAISQMESLMVSSQQEFDFLLDFINDNIVVTH